MFFLSLPFAISGCPLFSDFFLKLRLFLQNKTTELFYRDNNHIFRLVVRLSIEP